MRLEFENGTVIEDPDDAAIADGLATLGSDNPFAILGSDGMTYMQTSGDPQQGFVLQYQEGSTREHFRCTDDTLPLQRVVAAFQKFARSDNSYKQDFEWEKQHVGGGCLGALIFLTVAVCSSGLGALLLA